MIQWEKIEDDLLLFFKNLWGVEEFQKRKKTLPKLLTDRRVSVWLFQSIPNIGQQVQYRASIRRRDLAYAMRDATTYSIMNPNKWFVILDTLGKIEAMPTKVAP